MTQRVLTAAGIFIVLLASACGKSDADVQKAVSARLTADNISGVTVSVSDGVATLTGEVEDSSVLSKAEASAKAVDGVRSVDASGLKIRPVAAPSADDQELTRTVEENLRKAGCSGARVNVENGIVTITGTVPDDKYAECLLVANVPDAIGFQNMLEQSN